MRRGGVLSQQLHAPAVVEGRAHDGQEHPCHGPTDCDLEHLDCGVAVALGLGRQTRHAGTDDARLVGKAEKHLDAATRGRHFVAEGAAQRLGARGACQRTDDLERVVSSRGL